MAEGGVQFGARRQTDQSSRYLQWMYDSSWLSHHLQAWVTKASLLRVSVWMLKTPLPEETIGDRVIAISEWAPLLSVLLDLPVGYFTWFGNGYASCWLMHLSSLGCLWSGLCPMSSLSGWGASLIVSAEPWLLSHDWAISRPSQPWRSWSSLERAPYSFTRGEEASGLTPRVLMAPFLKFTNPA